MQERYYTHAMWKVQAGKEAEFVAAWRALSEVFSSFDGKPLWALLPTVFFSFGPWQSLADIEGHALGP